MLSSMTGFGRGVINAPFGRIIVEIQSVNRKYFEAFISLPKEFSRFELELRKWVSEVIFRGQVSVRVYLIPHPDRVKELLPDVDMLMGLKSGWEKICGQLGMESSVITLPFLVENLPQQHKQEFASDEDLPFLQECVEGALAELLKMKRTEGKALCRDLEGRLKSLEKMIRQVEGLCPDASRKMRERLMEKMADILKPGIETEERLLREVALFAERVDVSEEITRFRSHIGQFEGLLASTEGVMGRKMDFLIQEMGREVNTLGSKSVEAQISHLVVEIKSELEKMREQVQNIE